MRLRNFKGRVCALMVVLAAAAMALRSQPMEIVLPRPCVVEVRLTEKTECHGPDRKHLSCTNLVMLVKPKCEEIRVK
jgi:hypothetical protein